MGLSENKEEECEKIWGGDNEKVIRKVVVGEREGMRWSEKRVWGKREKYEIRWRWRKLRFACPNNGIWKPTVEHVHFVYLLGAPNHRYIYVGILHASKFLTDKKLCPF